LLPLLSLPSFTLSLDDSFSARERTLFFAAPTPTLPVAVLLLLLLLITGATDRYA